MSDELKFVSEYAARGQAACKKCKQKLEKNALRLGKIVPNPFGSDGGDMKQWYHANCLFDTFARARATTKKIETVGDIQGFQDLKDDDKKLIKQHIQDLIANQKSPKKAATPKKTVQTTIDVVRSPKKSPEGGGGGGADAGAGPSNAGGSSPKKVLRLKENDDAAAVAVDDAFRTFRKLCAEIAEESSYTGKQRIVRDFLNKGSTGGGFAGDLHLLMKLLLPGFVKRVYNLKDRQLAKLFAGVFRADAEEMLSDLDQGDVPETVRSFFEKSTGAVRPSAKSTLSNQEVDQFLDQLTKISREDDQQRELAAIARKCTANDLKMVVRLIKHDLRINTGAKHILEALDPKAYEAFQTSRNLYDVLERVVEKKKGGLTKELSVRANLMTPVLPMLAEACKSVQTAMKKCPQGFYAEIKYDGERLQLHKKGAQFDFFSRNLKPVQPHKTQFLKEYIPKAFPGGEQLIIDGEVLLVDNKSGTPLPFGTLGKHKKEAFKDASVCLIVFDILHLNNDNLMLKPIKERRRLLEKHMVEVENHVKFSEISFMNQPDQLQQLLNRVFREGLEGLVLKDVNSIYEPGKRHWLKVKKDYLADGAMADTADLVVLGAYYGTGNKGGMMSVFLMGAWDPDSKRWCTVTKVGNGHDDRTLAKLQVDLMPNMEKISKDAAKLPPWLDCTRPLCPDLVVKDPRKAPVWEVTGAEFSKTDRHTARGVSIRFPRVTKIRSDKDWEEATNVPRLLQLYKTSKAPTDLQVPGAGAGTGAGAGAGAFDPDNDDTPTKPAAAVTDATASPSKTNRKQLAFLDDSEEEEEEEVVAKKKPAIAPRATKPKKPVSSDDELDEDDLEVLAGAGAGAPPDRKRRKRPAANYVESDNDEDDEEEEEEDDDSDASVESYEVPKKKKMKNADLPPCRYGAACYQKNPLHRQKFSHPAPPPAAAAAADDDDDDVVGERRKKMKLRNLKDVFTGMVFAPASGQNFSDKELQQFRRYIVALNGSFQKDADDGDTCTHLLMRQENVLPQQPGAAAPRVSVAWLWRCVEAEKLLPF